VSSIDFTAFDALTFDCYGTLIDWETGISAALRRVLRAHCVQCDENDVLENFGWHQAALEAGPYLSYAQVLAEALRRVGHDLGLEPAAAEVAEFSRSVGEWPAFPDSADALQRLKERFRLGVITNCDDDLFASTNRRLGIEFDWIVTAQQAEAYKPSLRNFELTFKRTGIPPERILHVAQSAFHDHVPAKRLGMTTVRINRRRGRQGIGPMAPAQVTPDLAVPDMRALAELAAE